MRKKSLPRCPYCGKPLNFFESFIVKNKGKYYCSACSKKSAVTFEEWMYKFSWVCELVSFAILAVLVLFTESKSLLCLLAVVMPFLVFYIVVPFSVVLEPCKQVNLKTVVERAKIRNDHTQSFSKIGKEFQNDRRKINHIESFPKDNS